MRVERAANERKRGRTANNDRAGGGCKRYGINKPGDGVIVGCNEITRHGRKGERALKLKEACKVHRDELATYATADADRQTGTRRLAPVPRFGTIILNGTSYLSVMPCQSGERWGCSGSG